MADDIQDRSPVLTHSQSINRLREITTELERLAELEEPSIDDENYFRELRDEHARVDKHRKRLERDADLARVKAATDAVGARNYAGNGNGLRVEHGSDHGYDRDAILEPDSIDAKRFRNPWDLSEVRTYGRDPADLAREYRARALSAVEQMQSANDRVREAATKIIEEFDNSDAKIAQFALATSSPEYLRAWSKMARNRQSLLTPEEQRAMSLTDSAGGFLVPFQLDPTVIITANGSRNQVRQVARQVVAVGDTWYGVSSGAVSWSWDAEAATVSDDTTTFAQPSVPVYKAAGFIPISIEALEDEANVAAEVARLLAFGRDVLEAAAFATGSGIGQPTGIVTALTGGGSEVASTTADVFAAADIYKLDGALPARYRADAAWLGNRATYNLVRQFDTGGGAQMWERIGADVPPLLLGRPALESEDMDGVINALAANYLLVLGDFSNYVIADRVGMRIEFIPHLFAGTTPNIWPKGQRGWYAYYRVGADSVNDAGFRMLNV